MTRAEEFVKTLETDSELKSKLSAATSSEDAKKIVTDAGFGDVSSADVKALGETDELSENELAGASGAGFSIGVGFSF
jgi:predicted ribosomally synthesized peptide with nif11-like leader